MMSARLFCGVLVPAVLWAHAMSPAWAGEGTEVRCRHDGAVRRIEVVRNPVPPRRCEMRYGEPAQGRASRVVWFSERDHGFCHERADALIATLARRGWVCDVIPKRNVAAGSGREVGMESNARAYPAPTVPRPR